MHRSVCSREPVNRRQVLQVGASGLLGLALPQLLCAGSRQASVRTPARADACILIFLSGGPSHLDLWDLKPKAPEQVRGEFRPVDTSVPGVRLSEHLPRLAAAMHHCTLIRTMQHSVNVNHGSAVYTALTGHNRGDSSVATGASSTDYPAIGSVTARCRPPNSPTLPYVAMPFITRDGPGGPPVPGFSGGWLGRSGNPLFVLRDPNSPAFAMSELTSQIAHDRVASRQELLGRLDARVPGGQLNFQEMNAFREMAFELLTSAAVQRAFQIEHEPAAVRQKYGRNIYGQSVLLARRLIEAGTRVAAISWAPDANSTWDTHSNNFTKLKGELLPQLDAAVASLLTDLAERSLLRRTLVVVMGEFGRTPSINANAGRDHWNHCYSLLLCGGGTKGGFVHGDSDKFGAHPSTNPVAPADVIATIYECLGIPADLELHDRLQRPFPLVPWGSTIEEVLA